MKVPVPTDIPAAEQLGRVHFVGIGGAALSGLARIMSARGVVVTGSDAADSAMLKQLRAEGITCWVGHDAAHVDGADTVVVSTAIGADNPEVLHAFERGLRVWPRSAAVQSVLLGRDAVVVTGTHGKTTTSSMLATMLLHCGAEPSYAVGSTLAATGRNAAAGTGDIFVVEGDESDAAILVYTPAGAVITNVEVDHLDQFGTAQRYAAQFVDFLDRIRPRGFCVLCIDDPGAAALVGPAKERGLCVVTVGRSAAAGLRMLDVRTGPAVGDDGANEFDVDRAGTLLGTVTLRVPGAAYAMDALGALAAGLELGCRWECLVEALADFRGSARRMEWKGVAAGVTVYDSYAHHPTEISGDLAAARTLSGAGRLVVCFQPHLFSRTQEFGAAMGRALAAADEVVVMDVYPAREQPIAGVSGALVADAVTLPTGRVHYEPDQAVVARTVAGLAMPGDLVLTLGAGDVTDIGQQVLDLLAGQEVDQ